MRYIAVDLETHIFYSGVRGNFPHLEYKPKELQEYQKLWSFLLKCQITFLSALRIIRDKQFSYFKHICPSLHLRRSAAFSLERF
jgi:hypothetical protein